MEVVSKMKRSFFIISVLIGTQKIMPACAEASAGEARIVQLNRLLMVKVPSAAEALAQATQL